jgi:hypothetical protein
MNCSCSGSSSSNTNVRYSAASEGGAGAPKSGQTAPLITLYFAKFIWRVVRGYLVTKAKF